MLSRISAYSGTSDSFFLKNEKAVFNGEYQLCEAGIEISVHQDHHLSSLSRPRDAKRLLDGFFYPILTLMIYYYICSTCNK